MRSVDHCLLYLIEWALVDLCLISDWVFDSVASLSRAHNDVGGVGLDDTVSSAVEISGLRHVIGCSWGCWLHVDLLFV